MTVVVEVSACGCVASQDRGASVWLLFQIVLAQVAWIVDVVDTLLSSSLHTANPSVRDTACIDSEEQTIRCATKLQPSRCQRDRIGKYAQAYPCDGPLRGAKKERE